MVRVYICIYDARVAAKDFVRGRPAILSGLTAALIFIAIYIMYVSSCVLLTALEAGLVEFVASGDALFSGVHGLVALGALGVFDWLERHVDVLF